MKANQNSALCQLSNEHNKVPEAVAKPLVNSQVQTLPGNRLPKQSIRLSHISFYQGWQSFNYEITQNPFFSHSIPNATPLEQRASVSDPVDQNSGKMIGKSQQLDDSKQEVKPALTWLRPLPGRFKGKFKSEFAFQTIEKRRSLKWSIISNLDILNLELSELGQYRKRRKRVAIASRKFRPNSLTRQYFEGNNLQNKSQEPDQYILWRKFMNIHFLDKKSCKKNKTKTILKQEKLPRIKQTQIYERQVETNRLCQFERSLQNAQNLVKIQEIGPEAKSQSYISLAQLSQFSPVYFNYEAYLATKKQSYKIHQYDHID